PPHRAPSSPLSLHDALPISGIYKKHGIDAEIRMGGPQQDPSALLLAGKVDFIMSNAFVGLNYAKENLPFLVIASMFQKDPQVLIDRKSTRLNSSHRTISYAV